MHGEESKRERRFGSLVLLLVLAALIGGGLWIVGALLDLRKAQECIGTGRRNCATPVEVPIRER